MFFFFFLTFLRKLAALASLTCQRSSTFQDSGVLHHGAPRREDRGGGGAAARLHRGRQLPVDEPSPAGTKEQVIEIKENKSVVGD